MRKLIDISVPLTSRLTKWPGSFGFERVWTKRIATGDECNNSKIKCDSHAGTHLDAPSHFLKNGDPLDRIDLDTLVGPCTVIHIQGRDKITGRVLQKSLAANDCERVLLRTDNSLMWADKTQPFSHEYACLPPDGAEYLAQRQKVRLIGIDYLSIGDMVDGTQTHRVLCKAGIVILEGLSLASVAPGPYELICLPLNIPGAEGAPARAVLR